MPDANNRKIGQERTESTLGNCTDAWTAKVYEGRIAEIRKLVAQTDSDYNPVGSLTGIQCCELMYGENWRDYIVPNPILFPKASRVEDLAPWAAADTPPAERGPRCRALIRILGSKGAGVASRPTPADFQAALQGRERTKSSSVLLSIWMNEAQPEDLVQAWIAGCYSWRELARACELNGVETAQNAKLLNEVLQRCRTPPE